MVLNLDHKGVGEQANYEKNPNRHYKAFSDSVEL